MQDKTAGFKVRQNRRFVILVFFQSLQGWQLFETKAHWPYYR